MFEEAQSQPDTQNKPVEDIFEKTDATSQQPPSQPSAPAPSSGGSKKWLLIIAIVFLLAAGVFTGTYVFLSMQDGSETAEAPQIADDVVNVLPPVASNETNIPEEGDIEEEFADIFARNPIGGGLEEETNVEANPDAEDSVLIVEEEVSEETQVGLGETEITEAEPFVETETGETFENVSGEISEEIGTVAEEEVSDMRCTAENVFTLSRVPPSDTVDTDADGLTDYEEVMVYATNPCVVDSDNDTYTDGQEVCNGYNPSGLGALPEDMPVKENCEL